MKKGFKGFNKGLVCREKQYKENSTFSQDGDIELCGNGMHFCEKPLDVFDFYPPGPGTEYTEVEAIGESESDNSKIVTNKLKIFSKISIAKMFKMHFEMIFDKIEVGNGVTNTAGYKAHANTAGNEAHANTAGNEAHANTAGYKAHANTAGNEAHANTAGYKAHANTAGYEAHANTAGNYAHANTAGYEAISSSLGVNSRSRAEKGWIVVVDWRYDEKWYIHDIKRAKVGKHKINGELIKPDVWYWFENGKLESCTN